MGDFKRGMVVFQKLMHWDHAQPSLRFTKNGQKKIIYPVSSSSVGKNTLLMSEDRGDSWFKLIERQQQLK